MKTSELKQHVIDIVKGSLGAFLVAGGLAFLQYLGAHIPELIQYLTSAGGATAAIKMMRFRV